MIDEENLDDNFVGRRGKSVSGTMPSWALLSKWERTGVYEDPKQLREFHRRELKDLSCDKPWLESDMPFNGGVDPHTGGTRAGASHSKSVLNRHFGGRRTNTDPYLPDGTFLDWEYLNNRDEYIKGDKYSANFTAGGQGVSRKHGDLNWEEYNRQKKYRMKYVKFYKDDDYSTVEHGVSPAQMSENIHKARFEGLKKLKVFRKSYDGRTPGSNPLFDRGAEVKYQNISQKYREENVQTNYRQWQPDDSNIQDFVDNDQEETDGQLGRDNPTILQPGDSKILNEGIISQKLANVFQDRGVQHSLSVVIDTLNNAKHSKTTGYETEGFTNSQRTLGIQNHNSGMSGQQAIESRAFEIARSLQVDMNNRKTAEPFENRGRMTNTFVSTKIHEYLGLANRRLGPQEITINLKESSLNTGLQPGAEVMDLDAITKKSMAAALDLPRSQINSKIAHYKDDSRNTVNFSNIQPKTRNALPVAYGENYGSNSRDSIAFKSAKNLYDGLKSAFTREDMEFTEGVEDKHDRSTAKGKGTTRRNQIDEREVQDEIGPTPRL